MPSVSTLTLHIPCSAEAPIKGFLERRKGRRGEWEEQGGMMRWLGSVMDGWMERKGDGVLCVG